MKKRLLFLIFTCILLSAALEGCSQKTEDFDEPSQEADEAEASASLENADASQESSPVEFEAIAIDGELISSDIFGDSRLTMINVWATYCNPCLNEMPELGELASEYEPEDFQILGVISDVTAYGKVEELDLAKSLIEETNAAYPHLLLNESLFYSLVYDVTAVPTTFFLNEEGEILDTVVGAMDKTSWEEKIDALLEEL